MNTQCNVMSGNQYADDASPGNTHAPAKNLLQRLLRFIDVIRQQRIDRQAFSHLLTLDDNMLRDIGVSRADVEWAKGLPLSSNAALELEKLARRTKYNHW